MNKLARYLKLFFVVLIISIIAVINYFYQDDYPWFINIISIIAFFVIAGILGTSTSGSIGNGSDDWDDD